MKVSLVLLVFLFSLSIYGQSNIRNPHRPLQGFGPNAVENNLDTRLSRGIAKANFESQSGAENQIDSRFGPLQGQPLLNKKSVNLNKAKDLNAVLFWPSQIVIDNGRRTSYTYDIKGNILTQLNEELTNNSWVNIQEYSCTYDNKGNLLTFLNRHWTNNSWVNFDTSTYTYDSNGNELTYLYKTWTNNTWLNIKRYTRTYDNNRKMLTELGEYWTNNSWVNSSKGTYAYDNNGNMSISKKDSSWENNPWFEHNNGAYTYDNNGNMLTSINEHLFGTFVSESYRYTYTYDIKGNKLTYLDERWTNTSWVYSGRSTYTYDNSGNKLTYLYEMWTNNSWVNSRKSTYTYNNSGNMLTGLDATWTNNNSWVNSGRNTYTYDNTGKYELTSISETFTNNDWVKLNKDTTAYDKNWNAVHWEYFVGQNNSWAAGTGDINKIIKNYKLYSDFMYFYYGHIVDIQYTFSNTQGWQTTLKVKDNGSASTNIIFGSVPNATNGIDADLGEEALPPLPPTGIFDTRFELPVTPAVYSLKDYRSDTTKAPIISWTIKFQPGSGGYPVTLTWDPSTLPMGICTLQDNLTTAGNIVNVNMQTTNTATITNTGISTLLIKYTKQTCKDVLLYSGWNMIGVPVSAPDMKAASLFTRATSPVYGYNAGYIGYSELSPGKGYWIRYPVNDVINICGNLVTPQTVSLAAGWNIISVYENQVSSQTTNPPGIITSSFWGYSGGYTKVTTLQSGTAYWVQASAAGVLNIPAALVKSNSVSASSDIDPKWSSVQLSDAAGNKSSLYFSAAAIQDLSKFELPPVPPAGIFDVRFASQSFVENLNGSSKVISINGASYPVAIRAEGIDLLIKDNATGKLINSVVKSGSSITITNENINSIEVSGIAKPAAYELSQNYPNPFNPATMIRFGLPENTRVRLTIYNQIGEQVAELVNGQMEAGYHQITWNASTMSSGVYFYEIKTEKFRSVKKLILMK